MKILKVGKIVNTHGIKGEIKIYPYTDNIDNLSNIKYFYFEDNTKINVLSKKTVKNMIIFKLENINSVEMAKTLINKFIYIEKEDIVETDTYYVEDLIGIKVYENDKYIGDITYVYQTGANDVYEVEKQDKSKIYIPAIKQVVLNIDVVNNRMDIELMEGLDA